MKEGNENKAEQILNEAAAQGFRWVAGDIFSGRFGARNTWFLVRRGENSGYTYRMLQRSETSRLFCDLTEAGAQGFRLVPRILQPTGEFPLLVLERPPDGVPVVYTALEVENDDEKATRALNEARKKGAVIAAVNGRSLSDEPIVILESRADAATDDRAYRVVTTKKLSTFEKELAQAGADGFRFLCCAVHNAVLERPASQEARRDYRLASAWLGQNVEKDLAELGSQGFRVVGAPNLNDEWAFLLERVSAASKRYEYRLKNVGTDEPSTSS